MKIPRLILTLFLLFSGSLSAQDLIITHQKDSLAVTITGEDAENVYMRMMQKGRLIETQLPKRNIETIVHDHFRQQKYRLRPYDYTRYQFLVSFGYSHRQQTVDLPNPSGIISGGGFHYFFHRNFGIGARYTFHYYDKHETKTKHHYVAPSLYLRLPVGRQKYSIGLNPSFGYSAYREDLPQYNSTIKRMDRIEKDDWALSCELSFNRRLAKGSELSLFFNYTGGPVKGGKHYRSDNNKVSDTDVYLQCVNMGIAYRIGFGQR